MLRQCIISILILLCLSIGNAEDNNLFIMDSPPAKTKPDVVKPPVKKTPQILKKEEPIITKKPAPPATKVVIPRVQETVQEESLFIDYWGLGTEENLVREHIEEESSGRVSTEEDLEREDTESASESSELKPSSPLIESSPRPKPRPKPKPVLKPTPKPEVKPKPAPKPAPVPKAPPKKEKPAGPLRCDLPSKVAPACSQNGIREGLEKVLNDCNTVRCYIRLFHMETSCRPFLTHQAIVTAYGMCSIEKDYNLRKRFGSDCHKIDTVEGQIKCCRKMMITVGKKYFEPVKVGRLPKCE